MSIELKNMREFSAALRAVRSATKKDEAEIVNKALKDVAFRAASFTPKTTAAKIGQELNKQLLARIAARDLGKGFTRAQLKQRMAAILKRRKAGVNALRAGWVPAIQALGGTFRGARLRAGGTAAKGIAKKATISQLYGLIRNAVVTVDAKGRAFSADQIAVAVSALNKAIAFVSADRNAYAQRKIDATLRKHSDR